VKLKKNIYKRVKKKNHKKDDQIENTNTWSKKPKHVKIFNSFFYIKKYKCNSKNLCMYPIK
jgi:hypothetical protein